MKNNYGQICFSAEVVMTQPSQLFVFLQPLVFLIRDWADKEAYPYGREGGTAYVKKILFVGIIIRTGI